MKKFVFHLLRLGGFYRSKFMRRQILPYLMKQNHADRYWLYRLVDAEDIVYSDLIVRKIAPIYKDLPLSFVDVGCSGGIDKEWLEFPGGNISIVGIDPVQEEVDRLCEGENRSNLAYHSFFIGNGNTDSLDQANLIKEKFFESFSLHLANEHGQIEDFAGNLQLESVDRSSTEKVTLDEFCGRFLNGQCDFVKIDTDGYDIDVLNSGGSCLGNALGIQAEMVFPHFGVSNCNSFSRIDNYLQSMGFVLVKMSPLSLYSLKELPSTFEYDIYAQTVHGIPWQCDGVYLRDFTTPEACREFGEIDFPILCKMLSLYAFFDLHDWAVKLVLGHSEIFCKNGFDTDELLDLLTPEVFGCKLTYQQYINLFKSNPSLFLRKNLDQLEKQAKSLSRKGVD